MISSLRLTSPLFKRDLPELGTGAAFPGGCLTASCYRRSLTRQHDVCLPGLPSSRTESGQLTCRGKPSQATPLCGVVIDGLLIRTLLFQMCTHSDCSENI